MSRPRKNRVALRSCQGFIMRYISHSDALALEASDPSVAALSSGDLQFQNYQRGRDDSPTSLTPSDMKLNAGEHGDPMPEEERRDGFIDPVEAAREKVSAWLTVGDVKREVLVGDYCPIFFILHKDGNAVRVSLCRDPYTSF
jgi:hypothetical protein